VSTLNLRAEGSVVFAEIDAPPMNLLGPELVRDVVSVIERAEAGDSVRVLVFSSADPDYFIPMSISLPFPHLNERTRAMTASFHFHATTNATPEQYVAGLTDFGSGRAELFGNSADSYLKVYSRGTSDADVTEGSAGVWERLHYDWSDPNHVVLTTTDSNAWSDHSSHTYNFKRNTDGTTDIDYDVVRDGKNLKGHFFSFLFRTVAKGKLEKAFEGSVKAVEARNNRGPKAAP